jgi:hypothetical protein
MSRPKEVTVNPALRDDLMNIPTRLSPAAQRPRARRRAPAPFRLDDRTTHRLATIGD